MTFSPLATGTIPHHNKFSSRQGRQVLKVVQHHWAGIKGGDTRLADPNAKASSTYLVYSDGTIKGQVPEEFRPWTSGSFAADGDAITIEVQNSGVGNDWPITDEAQRAIERLLADIAKRYGWGAVAATNYRGHREFAATLCPGPYLWDRMVSIRNEAHRILVGGKTEEKVEAPVAPPVLQKSTWQLADEVLAGLHGSGEARRRSLGARYGAVQAEVNRRLAVPAKPVNNKPVPPRPKSVAQLADEVMAGAHGNGADRRKSLGSSFNAVQAEINRRLGTGKTKGPDIASLANAVMRGEYGNGPERRRRLGANYAAVQAEVNRRLRR